MGQGSHFTIRNRTSRRFVLQDHETSSSSMNAWDFTKNGVIEPGSNLERVYIEYGYSPFYQPEGVAVYVSDDGASRFTIRADNTLSISLDGEQAKDLGWLHDEEMIVPVYQSETDRLTIPEGSDWMAGIRDNTLMKNLSIPGTHDSGTFASKMRIGPGSFSGAVFDAVQAGAATCQSLTIDEQLNRGIRFLDIRLRELDGDLFIQHGKPPFGVTYNYTFDRVLADVRHFLSDHKRETVLMSIKKDDGDAFGDLWTTKYGQQADLLTNFRPDTTTLHDVRGKIALFTREGFVPGWQLNIPDNPKKHQGNGCWVQDNYDMNGTRVGEKIDAINDFMQLVAWDHDRNLSLNFTSMVGGAGIPAPYLAALEINSFLKKRLNTLSAGCLGIVVMDYPDADLIRRVFITNYEQ